MSVYSMCLYKYTPYTCPQEYMFVYGCVYTPYTTIYSTFMSARCVHMRNFIPVNRDEKGTRRLEYKGKMAPRELISIVPLAVALATRVTLLLQVYGILLKWKIGQVSQNTATEATKRPQLRYFHLGQPGWSVR